MKAKSFVTIMIVIAVVALLLRFGLEKIIKFGISQNEAAAQDSLRLVSQALENYAKANNGRYPEDFSSLTNAQPPYLESNHVYEGQSKGYLYSCARLSISGYSCSAVPLKCAFTGSKNYSITTGGLFVSEDCSRKD